LTVAPIAKKLKFEGKVYYWVKPGHISAEDRNFRASLTIRVLLSYKVRIGYGTGLLQRNSEKKLLSSQEQEREGTVKKKAFPYQLEWRMTMQKQFYSTRPTFLTFLHRLTARSGWGNNCKFRCIPKVLQFFSLNLVEFIYLVRIPTWKIDQWRRIENSEESSDWWVSQAEIQKKQMNSTSSCKRNCEVFMSQLILWHRLCSEWMQSGGESSL
jgi:hypothetical protein